jgi:DNA-binding MarR family transcriptional regulator
MPMTASPPRGAVRNGAAHALQEQSIGYLVRYAHRAFVKTLAVELGRFGILTGQWSVLRVLWQQEGLSQVELAERLRVEKASLTAMLDGMEKAGVIARTRNRDDRRKVNIRLTAKGRALKARLLPFGDKINRRAAKGLTSGEASQLRRLLSRLIVNLEA